jgi:hypothetical protein
LDEIETNIFEEENRFHMVLKVGERGKYIPDANTNFL